MKKVHGGILICDVLFVTAAIFTSVIDVFLGIDMAETINFSFCFAGNSYIVHAIESSKIFLNFYWHKTKKGHPKTQTMQTADCRLQTADCRPCRPCRLRRPCRLTTFF